MYFAALTERFYKNFYCFFYISETISEYVFILQLSFEVIMKVGSGCKGITQSVGSKKNFV